MLRSTFLAAGAAALVASAAAQTSQSPTRLTAPERIPSPVKYGGVYHVQSHTISRGVTTVSNFGSADTVYNNTAQTPYFTGLIGPTGAFAGSTMTDSGAIPSTQNFNVTGVTRDTNLIKGFAFAYCDLDATGALSAWDVGFYESLAPCTSVLAAPPATSTVQLTALPSGGCWLFDIDLTGAEFCIGGDGGDGIFDDDPALDSFGWSLTYTGAGTAAAGPLFAGDPSATDTGYFNGNFPPGPPPAVNPPAPAPIAGSGTYYNPLSNCTSGFLVNGPRETGSGFGTQDIFYIDDPATTNTGCYFFGGYFNLAGTCGNGTGAGGGTGNSVFSSYYMEIESDADCGSGPGGPIVVSTPTSCAATANTSGVAGTCTALGSAVAAGNNLILRAENLPTVPQGVFGIFLHGSNDISGNPIVSGNGVLCIGPAGRFNLQNQIKQANAQGVAELSTVTGEFSLGTLPTGANPPLTAAMAGNTSYFGFWHRDFTLPVVTGFNFTGTCAVTWQ